MGLHAQVLPEFGQRILDPFSAVVDLLFETLDEFFGLFVLVHQVLLNGCWFGRAPCHGH